MGAGEKKEGGVWELRGGLGERIGLGDGGGRRVW